MEKKASRWLPAVLVLAAASAWAPAAEPPKPAPAGEVVRGKLVAKTDTSLDVQPEDEAQAIHCPLFPPGVTVKVDAKYQAFLRDLAIGSEVQLLVASEPAGRRVSSISVLAAPGKWGKFTGTIAKVGDGRLEFQEADGKKRVFAAPFTTGGPDKEIVAAMAKRNVGDRVEIRWREDDWVRAVTIRVLEISPEALAKPGFEGGTAVGKVVEKGPDFVVVKPDPGEAQRYGLQTVAGAKGAPDKDMVAAIAAVKVGDQVEAKWFKDGERRLCALKPAAPPAAKPPAATPPGADK
jgi:hypothetical protein